jgi:hypothetical protein
MIIKKDDVVVRGKITKMSFVPVLSDKCGCMDEITIQLGHAEAMELVRRVLSQRSSTSSTISITLKGSLLQLVGEE